MNDRREFSPKTQLLAFQRCNGYCEGASCGYTKLRPGRWHADHIIPCALGGDASLDNCQLLCEPCHRQKTGEKDIPAIAKTKRIQRRVAGIRKRSSFATNRDSEWKKKINGEVVRR